MKIFKNKTKLLREISNIKDISFVPTMGSLHNGHLSLIRKAKKKTKNILVSIYVNPKQFNLRSDFQKYPRKINKDIAMLKKMKIKYLYLPTHDDIYLFKPKSDIYLDQFSKKLCGKFKPGHFLGVINVVNRFIEIIKPRLIYLGLKDFQQLALIKLHFKKNKIKTKIVACPIIRGDNGIALSSRNYKLNNNQINIAGKVFTYLKNNKKKILNENSKKRQLLTINNIIKLGVSKIDYLECVNLKTLKKSKAEKNKINIFIAYYFNNIRLIDNL
jgi:pantoate--beta-alanine ligase